MQHGALTMNSIYSSPKDRGRNQAEDAELEGIYRQVGMSGVKFHEMIRNSY